jgi:hypothetical protein
MTIGEHDIVVLTRDLPEYGLTAGDVGAVVHVYPDSKRTKSNLSQGRGILSR